MEVEVGPAVVKFAFNSFEAAFRHLSDIVDLNDYGLLVGVEERPQLLNTHLDRPRVLTSFVADKFLFATSRADVVPTAGDLECIPEPKKWVRNFNLRQRGAHGSA